MGIRFSIFSGALALFLLPSVSAMAQFAEGDADRPHEDPAAREEYLFKRHADEHGAIASDALIKAKEQMDALRNAQKALPAKGLPVPQDAGIAQWEWLGPGNIGGRVRTILFNPTNANTIWAGSVSGGIWRTDNGGMSWYPVDDFMANLAVTSIVMDPTNNSVMYASTGEGTTFGDARTKGRQGAGIFKSIDGGVTWSQLPSTASYIWSMRLSHNSLLANTLLAAVSDGNWSGILLSTDGGTNWQKTLTGPVTQVHYYPGSANLAIAGGNPGVWTSTDAGKSWTPQATGAMNKLPADGGRCEVAGAQSVFETYYVSMDRNQGELWRSVDAGATWTLQNTGTNYLSRQGFYANAIWVDPNNDAVVVVGGLNLYRTTNGGTNLDRISKWECYPDCGGIIHSAHADQHVIVSPPGFNGTTNKTVYVGDDGGLQFTPDIFAAGNGGFGDGWTNFNNSIGITQFYSGSATSDGSLIVGGAQDNGQPRRVAPNGPNNWTSLYSFGDGGVAAIDPNNSSRVYGEYPDLLFKRSDDGGGSYGQKTSGLGDACDASAGSCPNALFVSPFVIDPSNSNTLYAGGKRIWQTLNNADSWSQVRDSLSDGELCSAIAVAPSDPAHIWLGYASGTVSLGSLVNGTWNWINRGNGTLPSKFVTDIAVHPGNAAEAIVTFGGFDTSNIYKTTDYGATWYRCRGSGALSIPAVQINTVRYHPQNPDWIYVGTDLGVLASDDHGATWKLTPLYQANEGPSNVAVFQLFWGNPQQLYAATYGRGMYRTKIYTDVYVDINNAGFQDGTAAFPFSQIPDAINAAGNGSRIIINTGTYPQTRMTFTKRGHILTPSGPVHIR